MTSAAVSNSTQWLSLVPQRAEASTPSPQSAVSGTAPLPCGGQLTTELEEKCVSGLSAIVATGAAGAGGGGSKRKSGPPELQPGRSVSMPPG